MRRYILLLSSAGFLAAICAGTGSHSQNRPTNGEIQFESQLLPLFKTPCVQCHNPNNKSGQLDLSSYESLLKSRAVVPGQSAKSLLFTRILHGGDRPQMPLGFAALPAAEIRKVKDWIDQGAKKGSTKAVVHWAFKRPAQKPAPTIPKDNWSFNDIDKFVLQKLIKTKITPSPDADKVTLIRRLYLDILGLTPTPQEVQNYLNDTNAKAYEHLVDSLLANPHFGERMALPWLDAARYADSNGFQQDGDNNQYVWRDWVVKSLNQDMPFDQFTIKQLAGDLLPNPTLDDLIATGFNRNHMLNGEGGAIPEEQRNVILFDRVDVTSTTWLGLTMSCARCHDHKYDPISQKDYYSFMAYFNNVPESGVPPGGNQYRIAEPFITAGTPAEMARLHDLNLNLAVLDAKLKSRLASQEIGTRFQTWLGTQKGSFELAKAANLVSSKWKSFQPKAFASFDAAFDAPMPDLTNETPNASTLNSLKDGEVYPLSGDNTVFTFVREFNCDAASPFLLSFGSDDAITVRLNNKIILTKKVTRAAIADSELIPVELPKGKSILELKIVNGGGIGGFVFNIYPGNLKPADTRILLKSQRSPEEQNMLFQSFLAELRDPEALNITNQKTRLAERKTTLEANLPKVMVMSEAQPRKTYIYVRGDYENHGESVKPAIPNLFKNATSPVQTNRLSLAKWIVSKENPMTARVIVNRLWQTIFGQGLMRTPESFGTQGEAPTHPELLDWLAQDFQQSGWKVKRFFKQIFMSHTYRQASKATKKQVEADPENRLLGRAPRYRVSSFFLRDSALRSSGLLNAKIGGKPVYPYQPKGIWDALSITKERDFTYPQSTGPDLYRRSLYTFWRRTVAPGNMFDSSSRQACTVRQQRSSTPLHALTMLNDITWVEASRALAAKVMLKEKEVGKQIAAIVQAIRSRAPEKQELALLQKTYGKVLQQFSSNPGSANEFLSQGEFRASPNIDQAKLAALTAIALAIYNSDEAMTRE